MTLGEIFTPHNAVAVAIEEGWICLACRSHRENHKHAVEHLRKVHKVTGLIEVTDKEITVVVWQ
jgi:hypothetical protein